MRRALMWILLWTSDLLMWSGFHRSRAWWWCIQTAACFEEWEDT